MIIDNRKNVVRYRFNEFIGAVITITLFTLVLTLPFFLDPFLGIGRIYWAVILLCGYIGLFAFHFYKDLNYIYFSDDKGRMVFRYYSIRPFADSKNAIEMAHKQFHEYVITKSGLRTYITFKQNAGGRIAEYPKVSITALTKNQREKLYQCLNKL